ncbi:hypothetical protein OG900_06715 [Streptomyces sp. NBC_00433]
MTFFEAFATPPPAPEPRRERRRPWHQRDHVLPASVPGDAQVVRTEAAAVWVGALRAYPNGFAFMMRAVRRELPGGGVRQGWPLWDLRPDPFRSAEGNTGLRLGIQYADGRRAATGEGIGRSPVEPAGPESIWLLEGGGSGNELSWQSEFWVSPLPPDGPVTLVSVWADAGAPEQRAELDGAAIRAAAARAVELWPEDEYLDDRPGYTLGTLVVAGPDEDDDPVTE